MASTIDSTAADSTAAAIAESFLQYSSAKLQQMTQAIHTCFANLDDETIWRRDASVQNSMGNLALHLCGNVRQWIGSYVGGLEDHRNRPEEFSTDAQMTREELLALLDETVNLAVGILGRVGPAARLAERVPVQDGKQATILEAIYQVVGHFQQHTGQIIFATKLWAGKDLGLYQAREKGQA